MPRPPTTTTALLLALLLLLAACAGGEDQGSTDDGASEAADGPATQASEPSDATEPGEAPAGQGSPSPTPPATSPSTTDDETPSGEATEITFYGLRDHESGLWLQPLRTTTEEEGVAAAALQALLDGPAGTDADVQPLAPQGTRLRGVDVDPDGLLTVDLSLGGGGLGAAFEDALVKGLVLTATQFPTVDRVQILVDGEVVETLYGHVEASQPLEPDPFAIVPIDIVEAVGVAGSGPGGGSIELSGTANTFEATLELTLLDAGGNVVEDTFATASCGTGCRGEWSHTFADLEPGTYTVTATEPDPSDGEGRPPFATSAEVTIP